MLAGVLVLVAYLCGSLPTGVWLGRSAGVDVRRTGSGNIGATNVARTVGLRPALFTLLGDIAKGFVPTIVARVLGLGPLAVALVALAAFGGHVFSVFLHFSGGKGVATGLGVCLAMAPQAAAIALPVFAAIALVTRYVSLASILAASVLPPAAIALRCAPPIVAATAAIAAIIVIRHRDNLVRLWRGVEPKFGVKR